MRRGDRPEDAQEVVDDLRAGRWDALDLPGDLLEVGVDQVDVDGLAAACATDATHTGRVAAHLLPLPPVAGPQPRSR